MKRRSNVIAVIVFILAVLFVFLLNPRNVHRLQGGFLGLISPFLRTGGDWDRRYKEYKGGLKKLGELEAENVQLRLRVQNLEATNQALRGAEAEKIRLQTALGYQAESPFKLVSARVNGRSPSNWWNAVQIDRGTASGVEIGMPVLTPDGLVGRVVNVSASAATVLLISDENCRVAATVEATKEQGILRVEVKGDRTSTNLQPKMTLNFLSKTAALQPGQKVLTSGAGGGYPPGVSLGEVVEFKPRELDGHAVIQPSVDFATLSDVFVVVGLKGGQP